jgi:hypothetical protein
MLKNMKETVSDWLTDLATDIADVLIDLAHVISSEHRIQRNIDEKTHQVLLDIAKGEIKPKDAQQKAYWSLY